MAGMGEILSTLRKQKGVTQEEMGKALGVSMQAVSRWENGGAPDIMLLPALANYFGVSIDELFGREGGSIPAEAAILKRLGGLPQEARIEEAFRLCWEIQRGIGGETKFRGQARPGRTARIPVAKQFAPFPAWIWTAVSPNSALAGGKTGAFSAQNRRVAGMPRCTTANGTQSYSRCSPSQTRMTPCFLFSGGTGIPSPLNYWKKRCTFHKSAPLKS